MAAIQTVRSRPPNAPPERVGELAHRWSYAVLVAALLRKGEGPDAGTPASRYECVVPELGRVWIGQDREASAALAEVLSDRCGQDNPILAILTEGLSDRPSAAAPVDRARGHQHPSDIEPLDVSGTEPALSATEALATHVSPASSSAPPPPALFGWLRDGLAGGSIEINTRTALVHHVPEGRLLVSPGIFRSFLASRGADANSQEALMRLQRSALKAGWHLVGADGARVLGYAWTKNGKTTARVHGIVIEQPQRCSAMPPGGAGRGLERSPTGATSGSYAASRWTQLRSPGRRIASTSGEGSGGTSVTRSGSSRHGSLRISPCWTRPGGRA